MVYNGMFRPTDEKMERQEQPRSSRPTRLLMQWHKDDRSLSLFGDTRTSCGMWDDCPLMCLFCFTVELSRSLMASPGREIEGGWRDKHRFQLTLKAGDSRWDFGIPKWVSAWSLSHAMPFLPIHQKKLIKRMTGRYQARHSSWENSFSSYRPSTSWHTPGRWASGPQPHRGWCPSPVFSPQSCDDSTHAWGNRTTRGYS